MSLSVSSNRRILGNAATGMVGKFASVGLGFLTLGILVRGLGLEEYGKYVWLIAAIQLVFELSALRVWETVKRFLPEMLRERETSIGFIRFTALMVLSTSTLGMVIALGLTQLDWIASRGYDTGFDGVILTFAAIYFLRRFRPVMLATMEVFNHYVLSNALRIGLRGIELVAAVTAFHLLGTPDLGTFADVILALDLAANIGIGIYFSRFLRAQTGFGVLECVFSREGRIGHRLREILGFSLNSSMVMVLRAFQSQADVLLIGLLASSQAVAIYNVTKKIATTLSFAIAPMIDATFREFAIIKSGKLDAERPGTRRQIFLFVRYAALMGLGYWGALLLFMPLIASLLHVELDLIETPVWIIATVVPIASLLGWAHPYVVTFHTPRLATYVMAVAVVAQLVALWQYVPAHQAEGGAIAYSVFYVTWTLGYLVLMTVLKRRRSQPKPG